MINEYENRNLKNKNDQNQIRSSKNNNNNNNHVMMIMKCNQFILINSGFKRIQFIKIFTILDRNDVANGDVFDGDVNLAI
ncbi:hypothetical protein DERF_010646 [Dermatophagoides farinae]|uniref:Uncharacterized protein n=1 Tax=Dermatophagoides farinae TaxID=6954 RepID=A0A922HR85_DERFA|nr:hypothetical protein DERF_010646 [Dermatophagoides farinae]